MNVQSLQLEIAQRNYQNTAYRSRRTRNLLQNYDNLTNVPHKILFHVSCCNRCNIFVSLHDSKNTLLSPSNSNELIIHAFQGNGVNVYEKAFYLKQTHQIFQAMHL